MARVWARCRKGVLHAVPALDFGNGLHSYRGDRLVAEKRQVGLGKQLNTSGMYVSPAWGFWCLQLSF